ncbi:50S ribosomal protein L6 [bacterium]|nr:50S ribosomal protein L6 [bacterium]
MSRIGKKPIKIPEGVEVEIKDQEVVVKGPKGELVRQIPSEIKVEKKEDLLFVNPKVDIKKAKKVKALWGLYRTLIANMIIGVTEGFEKKLEIEGLGYKAALVGDELELKVGFTHPVKIKKPEGINFSVEKNVISVSGIDKEKVTQTAAKIRSVSPPEPYKGKGIRYQGEIIRRKAGKKVTGITK